MSVYLVTGGAGYIGSHTVVEVARRGYQPVVLDNLSEGHAEAVADARLETVDLADEARLDEVFKRYAFSAVIHFASLCYVGESVKDPRKYYEQNVGNAMTLLRVMLRHGVKRFILSSSCATYGEPIRLPIDEEHPQNPINPYGETKFMIEKMLGAYSRAYGLQFAALRYFNAAGASRDGRLGESHDPETHLIPLVLRAAQCGSAVDVFGDDYPTADGSCVRDYVHVEDLASAHLAALEWLESHDGSLAVNLGTGRGWSVKEVIATAAEVAKRPVRARISPRRPGDPPELVADPRKANQTLGWKPAYSDLRTIMETAWRWESNRRY